MSVEEATKVRFVTINCRKSSIKEIYASRRWSRRRPYMIKFLQEVGPSVFATQECKDDQAADIQHGLGAEWTFYSTYNTKVFWDTSKWDVVDKFQAVMDSGSVLGIKQHRFCSMVLLKSRKTGGTCWFAAAHLAAHESNAASWRVKQMKQVIGFLGARQAADGSMIGIDMNDRSQDSGPRKTASEAGYMPLRARGAATFMHKTRNSFNGWRPTKNESEWLDDVLTPRLVEPYYVSVELTDNTAFPVCASDHNGIRASVKF